MEFPEIQVAMVYGSFARGKESPSSDLDLAVAGAKALSADQKVDLINRLSSRLAREIDLIDLGTVTGTVAKEALTTGRLLFNRDPQRLAGILSRLMVEEEDFQKLRARLMSDRRKKAFRVG